MGWQWLNVLGDALAETGKDIAEPFVTTTNNILNTENPEWAEDRVEFRQAFWGEFNKENLKDAQYLVSGATELVAGENAPQWAKDRNDELIQANVTAWNATKDYSTWAWNNPRRFWALNAQGVTNAVTSTAGFLGDIGEGGVRGVGWLATGTFTGDWRWKDPDNFWDTTEFLNEAGQIRNWYHKDIEWAQKYFDRVDPASENAAFERVALYGSQAVAEIPAFFLAGGGIGGTIRTGSRFFKFAKTPKTFRTVDEIKNFDRIQAPIKATEKIAEKEKRLKYLQDVGFSPLRPLNLYRRYHLDAVIKNTRKHLKTVENIRDRTGAIKKLADLTQTTRHTAYKGLRQARQQLNSLRAQGASPKQIQAAEKSLERFEDAFDKGKKQVQAVQKLEELKSTNASAQKIAEATKVANNTTREAVKAIENTQSAMQKFARAWDTGTHQGRKILDPFESNLSAVTEFLGAGLAYYIGVKTDIQAGKAEIASGENLTSGDIDQIQSTTDSIDVDAALEEFEQWLKEQETGPDSGAPSTGNTTLSTLYNGNSSFTNFTPPSSSWSYPDFSGDFATGATADMSGPKRTFNITSSGIKTHTTSFITTLRLTDQQKQAFTYSFGNRFST